MERKQITPQLAEALNDYPLYSQDGKGKDAMCIALLSIGNIKWFVLEGQQKDNDTILFAIVCGLAETEYGYVSVNELESIEVDGTRYGFKGKFHVCQNLNFSPTKLKDIPNTELQDFLNRLYPATQE